MPNQHTNYICKNYAQAIFDVAQEGNCVEVVQEQIGSFVDCLYSDKQVLEFFHTPCISYNQKQDVFEKTFKDKLDLLSFKIISVILSNSVVEYLEEIKQDLDELIDRKNGLRFLEITVPGQIENQAQQDIVNKLQQACGQKIKAQFLVNPQIIGGIIIRQDDLVIDNSIKTALDKAAASIRNKI